MNQTIQLLGDTANASHKSPGKQPYARHLQVSEIQLMAALDFG